ncbi:hypothetical protein PV683_17565 [Streptomyces sp. AK08-01B]|nr:hypothetical protein [Streptomyces sp. AK08-01B]MDX3767540.1 hypothetical protein [Streptomyces sp. AK08-01B]
MTAVVMTSSGVAHPSRITVVVASTSARRTGAREGAPAVQRTHCRIPRPW